MKKMLLIIITLIILTNAYSQKKLSQVAINDFAVNSYWKYKHENNGNFNAFINTTLSRDGYSYSDIAVIMENLKTNEKGRESVFKAIYQVSGNYKEGLFNALYAMKLDAKNAKEISEYIYQKHAIKESIKVKEKPAVVVWRSPSSKFYEGTKYFCDSTGTWYYSVTIIERNILIKQYPGANNTREDKITPLATIRAVINGDNIVNSDNSPSNYKYENGDLFEKTGIGDQWEKFIECKK